MTYNTSRSRSKQHLTTTQHNTTQHSTAQHSAAQHSTAQHSIAQHSTAQHSTVQHSTAQYSTHNTHTHTAYTHNTHNIHQYTYTYLYNWQHKMSLTLYPSEEKNLCSCLLHFQADNFDNSQVEEVLILLTRICT